MGMSIENLRKKIDNLDIELVKLLKERAKVAIEIGEIKGKTGAKVLAPDREQKVIENVLDSDHTPIPDVGITAIFKEIISCCRNLESAPRVSHLGPEFTFAHQVAKKQFGATAEYIPTENIRQALEELEHGRADFAILPAENSTEGVVRETFDAMYNSANKIVAEVIVPITHSLYGKGELSKVTEVISHPQAIAQSRAWLRKNLLNVIEVSANSTAKAAEMAAEKNNMAAICTETAAEHYGLGLLAQRIENNSANSTRFFVVGSSTPRPSGNDKTTMLFTVKNDKGALSEILNIFKSYDINILMIESRPDKNVNWEYIFYLDIEGHLENGNIASALGEVQKNVQFLNILGSYPTAL